MSLTKQIETNHAVACWYRAQVLCGCFQWEIATPETSTGLPLYTHLHNIWNHWLRWRWTEWVKLPFLHSKSRQLQNFVDVCIGKLPYDVLGCHWTEEITTAWIASEPSIAIERWKKCCYAGISLWVYQASYKTISSRQSLWLNIGWSSTYIDWKLK